jgi:hypothetical protein
VEGTAALLIDVPAVFDHRSCSGSHVPRAILARYDARKQMCRSFSETVVAISPDGWKADIMPTARWFH